MEIEVKIKVTSHDAIRAALKARGAVCLGCVVETNDILDQSDASLAKRGAALRVRGVTPVEGHPPAATMTFKGPIQPGRFKTREEIEVPISDSANAVRILTSAGLRVVLHFEKRRESWQLDDCRVELDELPVLGCFVEIEGPAESAIDVALHSLGLQNEKVADRTYVAMLIEHCDSHGPADRVVRFADPGADR